MCSSKYRHALFVLDCCSGIGSGTTELNSAKRPEARLDAPRRIDWRSAEYRHPRYARKSEIYFFVLRISGKSIRCVITINDIVRIIRIYQAGFMKKITLKSTYYCDRHGGAVRRSANLFFRGRVLLKD
jgi:hypothetical protein